MAGAYRGEAMTETADPRSLVEMQERACAAHAARPLFGTKVGPEYQWTTYAEFAEKVDAFRAALAQLGVGRDSKVAVISDNRVEWAIGAYATYGLGAQYVPMYEAQSPKDWEYILRDSGACVLLVGTQKLHQLTVHLGQEIPTLRHQICFEAPPDATDSFHRHLEIGRRSPVPSVRPEPDDTAGLIYTSGTTGEPKGVMLGHRGILANVLNVNALFPITPEFRSLSFLPWAHAFGQVAELHTFVWFGASMALVRDVGTLMDEFQVVRPNVFVSVPRIFIRIHDGLQARVAQENKLKQWIFREGMALARARRWMQEDHRPSQLLEILYRIFDRIVCRTVRAKLGGRLEFAISGGAALADEIAAFISDLGITVYQGYGLTETSPVVSANHPGAMKLGTSGQPLPGVTVHILDEAGRELPPEVEGEVVITGPILMQGYYKRPEDTAQVIFDLHGERALRSGDTGVLDRDGYLRITGRIKEQYKLENGKFVAPSPLEEQLQLSPLIDQVMLYGANRPYNVALVVPAFEALARWAETQGVSARTPQALLDEPRVHAKIGEELAAYSGTFKAYERPKRWLLLRDAMTTENGQLTPTLKPKRRVVVARYDRDIAALYG